MLGTCSNNIYRGCGNGESISERIQVYQRSQNMQACATTTTKSFVIHCIRSTMEYTYGSKLLVRVSSILHTLHCYSTNVSTFSTVLREFRAASRCYRVQKTISDVIVRADDSK
jgi:hypothetical protein